MTSTMTQQAALAGINGDPRFNNDTGAMLAELAALALKLSPAMQGALIDATESCAHPGDVRLWCKLGTAQALQRRSLADRPPQRSEPCRVTAAGAAVRALLEIEVARAEAEEARTLGCTPPAGRLRCAEYSAAAAACIDRVSVEAAIAARRAAADNVAWERAARAAEEAAAQEAKRSEAARVAAALAAAGVTQRQAAAALRHLQLPEAEARPPLVPTRWSSTLAEALDVAEAWEVLDPAAPARPGVVLGRLTQKHLGFEILAMRRDGACRVYGGGSADREEAARWVAGVEGGA